MSSQPKAKSKGKQKEVTVVKKEAVVAEEAAPLKDLTQHVKDPVELMKQAFAIILDRELLAMAPRFLRDLGPLRIRELLLEEALGISSKRLLSILEGYKCPSDTESSESNDEQPVETISLDSISSDDDILLDGQPPKKKHMKKKTASKGAKDGKKKTKTPKSEDKSKKNKKTSKVKKTKPTETPVTQPDSGMTVLELLELQARARAIRAQLAAVATKDKNTENSQNESESDSGEESDDIEIKEEPPDIVEIESSSDEKEPAENNEQETTKNNQAKETNVNSKPQSTGESTNEPNSLKKPTRKIKLNRNNLVVSVSNSVSEKNKSTDSNIETAKRPSSDAETRSPKNSVSANDNKSAEKPSTSIERTNIGAVVENILDVKNTQNAKEPPINPVSDDEDAIALDLSDSEKLDVLEDLHSPKPHNAVPSQSNCGSTKIVKRNSAKRGNRSAKNDIKSKKIQKTFNMEKNKTSEKKSPNDDSNNDTDLSDGECSFSSDSVEMTDDIADNTSKTAQVAETNGPEKSALLIKNITDRQLEEDEKEVDAHLNDTFISDGENKIDDVETKDEDMKNKPKDDEASSKNTENMSAPIEIEDESNTNATELASKEEIDDFIFEISDDSENEASSGLSKEPTREEIEELSRKIDTEIDRENFSVTEGLSIDLQRGEEASTEVNDRSDSWKSRYLKTDKVKKVLATSQLCNALRKKNKELKKKLAQESAEKSSNEPDESPQKEEPPQPAENLPEGSISQYETLTGCSKYAEPVKESNENSMKEDAVQLMKMYKKLLKLNNVDGGGTAAERAEAKKQKKERKKAKREKKEKNKNKEKKKEAPQEAP